jgi:predicted nucleotidyltransferase
MPRSQVAKKPSYETLDDKIAAIVRRLVRRFNPEKVILFGSHARGTARPDSDLDLLVVMAFRGAKRDRQIEIRRALREFRIAKDIIVTTPEDFAWRKEIPGTIERPAAREGKVLYARS